MNKQKFNQASWNYPEETEILVIGKPNKQKTDWNKDFDKIIMDWEEIPISERLKIKGGYYGLMKDFISNLLQQQREDFKQTMANSNEWWNNRLKQEREKTLKEVEKIIGLDEFRVGQVYFFKKQLRKQIREIKTNY